MTLFEKQISPLGEGHARPESATSQRAVGYGACDVPNDRNVVPLSDAPDIGNARHTRYVKHACSNAVPYGKIDVLRVWVTCIGKDSAGASAVPYGETGSI